MPKLPRVSGAEVIRALTRLGFVSSPARKSCCSQANRRKWRERLRRPMHPELATGTLRGVLKQAGVSVEEFTAQL